MSTVLINTQADDLLLILEPRRPLAVEFDLTTDEDGTEVPYTLPVDARLELTVTAADGWSATIPSSDTDELLLLDVPVDVVNAWATRAVRPTYARIDVVSGAVATTWLRGAVQWHS